MRHKARWLIILLVIGAALSTGFYFWQTAQADAVFDGELTVSQLQRRVENGEALVVYFYGMSCADCVLSEPYLRAAIENLRESGALTMPVYKVEREANATVRSLYGIEQTPTVVIFADGLEISRSEGLVENRGHYEGFLQTME